MPEDRNDPHALPGGDDPALSAADEALVRSLLADAAPDEPLPADVAAALDSVIADLAAARAAAPPDELATRRARTRRRVLQGLVGAAAVVVAVVAVRPLVTPQGGGASSASSDARAQQPEAAGGAANDGFRSFAVAGRRPRLTTHDLAAQLHRLDEQRGFGSGTAARGPTGNGSGQGVAPQTYACAVPAPRRDADLVAVLLDGKPATLVVVSAADGTREALLYTCGDATRPVETVALPTR